MNTDVHQQIVEHMAIQISYLEKLLGRALEDSELDSLSEFFDSLDPELKDQFEVKVGLLI